MILGHQRHQRLGPEAGFGMLGIIAVLAAASVLIASALPDEWVAMDTDAGARTQAELDSIAVAGRDYFHDVGALPTSVDGLVVDPLVSGWSGPYLTLGGIDPRSGVASHQVDAWSQVYRVVTAGDVWTVTSDGLDGAAGTADDLAASVDVQSVRQLRTAQILSVVNPAIVQYNALYQATEPLSGSATAVLLQVVTKGLLPTTTGYTQDAWGTDLVPCPSGATIGALSSSNAVGLGCP